MAKMDHLQNTQQLEQSKSNIPVFDKKYITVVDFPSTSNDIEKILWLHEHAARKSVDIQMLNGKVYMGFEDDSDALIFRIKFL